MAEQLKNYFTITASYWAFTLTDGAIRMLVVLFFHQLGYSPFEVAMLFIFYEFFGVVTNLVGGYLAARIGLNVTMHIGMVLQVFALLMLAVPEPWLGVAYVMCAQALSGIAKDLNKMSAKSSIKMIVNGTDERADSQLFKWVAILTGSKNALKGIGFFLGALLLQVFGFQTALFILAGGLFLVFIISFIFLPRSLGQAKVKPKFTQVFSNHSNINWLSAARLFLFGARDVWFVIAVPVFLHSVLQWDFTQVGAFMACWVVFYGVIQAFAPKLVRFKNSARAARLLAFALLTVTVAITGLIYLESVNFAKGFGTGVDVFSLVDNKQVAAILVAGLFIFGAVFALNSALHSYLILAYSDNDKVAMNVGFYYMANAGGRLIGTVLSGMTYQLYGLVGSLCFSCLFIFMASILSLKLKTPRDGV